MSLTQVNNSASGWIVKHAALIPSGAPVLDLAAGSGRHARHMANQGHHVTLIDIDLERAQDLAADSRFSLMQYDLEKKPWPFAAGQFGAIIVVNYLHRSLFEWLSHSIMPGGVMLYDTFAVGNERFGKPSNPDYLLRAAELLEAFCSQFRVIAYDHGPTASHPRGVRQRFCGIRIDPS